MEPTNVKKKFYFRDPQIFPRGYRYYDTPDGQDFEKKLWYTTKLGAKFGVCVGSIYAMSEWDRGSRLRLIYNVVRTGTPFVLSSVVYTVTAYIVTKYREKDDALAAQAGGAAAGLVLGTWFRTPGLAVIAAIAGGTLLGLKKMSVQVGYEFPMSPMHKSYQSSWAMRKFDFSLTEEYPGNWTSIPRSIPEPPQPPPPPPPPPRKPTYKKRSLKNPDPTGEKWKQSE